MPRFDKICHQQPSIVTEGQPSFVVNCSKQREKGQHFLFNKLKNKEIIKKFLFGTQKAKEGALKT